MRLHRLPAAFLVLGGLCASREASAQYTVLRGVFAGNVQVTDNIQFVPYNSPDGAQKPRAGVVGELNPAVILSYETPRWLHELQYTLNLATVFGVGDQFNYTNRLELRSRYDVSELTQVNFAIRATQGGVTFFPEPEAGKPVAAFAPGVFTFGTLELAQGVNHRLGEFVVFTEQAQVQVFRPIQADPPRPGVYGGNMQLAIAYNDDPDNYAANLGVQLAATEEIECVNDQQCGAGRVCAVATRRCEIASTTAPALADEIRAQANAPMIANRLGVNYRHDFRNGFNGEVDLGVQQAMRLTDGGGQNWQPVGRLGLRFQEEDINFAITANHGAQLNPNAGGLVMATNVDLVGGVALDRQTRNWVVQLQTGYQRGTPFDTFGALLPGFHVAAADAALTYRPERWLPNFTAALRYQFRVQITEAQPGLAVLEDLIAMRHAVAINVGFEFPEKKPAP